MTSSSGDIALVAPSFYPMIGGIELYVQRIGKELCELGYSVHVYTPDSVFGRRLPNAEESVDGVFVHRIHVPIDLSYRIRVWPGLKSALVKRRHDLIHVYSHDSYSIFAMAAASEAGLPLLITTFGPFETHSDYG